MNRLEQVEARLARVERYNRALSLLCTGIAGVLIAACTTLADRESPRELIRASHLQIVDAAGQARVELGADAGGYALVIRDESGGERINLRHDAGETGLFVKDEAGDSRAGMAHFAHGGSGVALHGPGLRGAAVLYLKRGGSLSFIDADGSVEARFPDRP